MKTLYRSFRTAFLTLNLCALIGGVLLILNSLPVLTAGQSITEQAQNISATEAALGAALTCGSLLMFWLTASRRRSTPRNLSFAAGLKDFVRRYFPERQLYHRSHGSVQFMTLSAPVQVGLMIISLGFLSWVSFASVNAIFEKQICNAQKLRLMQDAMEVHAFSEDRLLEAYSLRDGVYEAVAKCVERECQTDELVRELAQLGPPGTPQFYGTPIVTSPTDHEPISVLTGINRYFFEQLKAIIKKMSESATGHNSIGLDDADYFNIYLSAVSAFVGAFLSFFMFMLFVQVLRSAGSVSGVDADAIIDELKKGNTP